MMSDEVGNNCVVLLYESIEIGVYSSIVDIHSE
jgi:hypothetical protein